MEKRTRLQRLSERFGDRATQRLAKDKDRLAALDRLRETLGYRATLARGYAVVRGDGALVTSQKEAAKATALEVEFKDGVLALGASTPKPAPKKSKPKEPDQRSLF
jgi:exodeoxyribonuclease VII large subunit